MTTEKRKETYRKSTAKLRKKKKAEGYVWFNVAVKPEWRVKLKELYNKLKGE